MSEIVCIIEFCFAFMLFLTGVTYKVTVNKTAAFCLQTVRLVGILYTGGRRSSTIISRFVRFFDKKNKKSRMSDKTQFFILTGDPG